MNPEDFVLVVVVVVIAVFIVGAWFAGQDTMALEICRNAGYVSGTYDKPTIICHGETELFIQTTIEKETE